jgi:hypothetical protein
VTERGKQKRIIWKLKELKNHVKVWHKEFLKGSKEKLLSLERDIKDLIIKLREDSTDLSAAFSLRQMEITRNEILRADEELWLDNDDKNSKYFHNYASYNRVKKHIWKIDNTLGDIVNDQNSIKEAAVNFFKD